MEENNEKMSQTDSALPSSEKQGSKQKDTSKIVAIICAILALAGIGFGTYKTLAESKLKTELNEAKTNLAAAEERSQRLSSILDLINEQEDAQKKNNTSEEQSADEKSNESGKSDSSSTNTSIPEAVAAGDSFIKPIEIDEKSALDFRLSATGKQYYNSEEYTISVYANREKFYCRVYNGKYQFDSEYIRECDASEHSGKVVDIVNGRMGNGMSNAPVFILTDAGEIEYTSTDNEHFGDIKKLSLPKKVVRIWGDGKVTGATVAKDEGYFLNSSGTYVIAEYEDGEIFSLHDYGK